MITWGIDLGGTKVECIVINFKDNDFEILCRQRIPTEAFKGYEHILSQIITLIQDISQKLSLTPNSLGIATPGIFDLNTKSIKNANIQAINGRNLSLDLELLLGISIIHANDANCFVLAETRLGVIKSLYSHKPKVVFGVILGTGVGGGLVIDGKIHEGLHGIAGEWGHNVLDKEGDTCYCGKRGCVERFISGTALEKYYFDNTHQTITFSEIYELHLKGETEATNTVKRLITYWGQAIAPVINLLDPEVIIIGGGLSNLDILYEESFSYIAPHIFNDRIETKILKHTLGDSAGVIGAALLGNLEYIND